MHKHRRLTTLGIAAALFALAWCLRAWQANAFITWDEPAWTYRSAQFLLALGDGRLRDTLQTGHPGVLTMWSGALGLLWHRVVTGNVTAEALRAVQALPELDIHDAGTLRMLGALLPYAKAGILPLYALFSAATFLLLDRLLPRGAALLASVMLLLEPYHLALTRVLHIDGITSACMLISTLAALVWSRERRTRWLIVSGATLGMATLTKSYAAMGAPIAALIILLAPTGSQPRWRASIMRLLCWGGAALGAFVLLWPAMWVSPRHVIETMFDLAFGYATAPGDATTAYYFGELREAIGWTFYPVVLYLRTTPTTLIGLALAIAGLIDGLLRTRRNRNISIPLAMLGLAVSYLALVSLGAKKFDRYALPALLALDVLAAWGYLAAWRWLGAGHEQVAHPRFAAGAICAIAGISLLWLAPYAPRHYFAHYNALAGGPSGAAEVLPLGWGEGVELAADYLASQPDADQNYVASWAVAGLAPKLLGGVMTPTHDHLPNADYVAFTIGDMQNGDEIAHRFADTYEPEFVGEIAGQPFVWVYANDYADDLADRLRDALAPGDLFVTDLPSTLERRYADDLPIQRIMTDDESLTAAMLHTTTQRQDASSGSRITYVRFDTDSQTNALLWQLDQNAVLESTETIPYGEMQVYRMIAGPEEFSEIALSPVGPPRPTYEGLALVRAGLAHDKVVAGQRIGVAIEWRTMVPLPEDYQVFLHLVDETGHKWGQRDLPLINASGEGTADWPTNRPQITRATVPLAPGTVPGRYTLVAGAYRWQDGQALGAPATLGEITVVTGGDSASLEDMGLSDADAIEIAPGIELLDHRLAAGSVGTGETVELWMTWRCVEETEFDWRVEVSLNDGDRRVTQTSWPAGEHHTTSQWRAGEVLVYPLTIEIDERLPSSSYTVYATLSRLHDRSDWIKSVIESGLKFLDTPVRYVRKGSGVYVDLGTLDVERIERHATLPSSATPIDARFGKDIALVGYELAETENTSAERQFRNAISVGLYWQALAPPHKDWTVFIHVLDETDSLQGQVDTQPAMGTRPTSGWLQDEIVWDSANVRLNDDAPPGQYRVAIGLYDAATGQRAPANDADGTPLLNDRLILPTTITIK